MVAHTTITLDKVTTEVTSSETHLEPSLEVRLVCISFLFFLPCSQDSDCDLGVQIGEWPGCIYMLQPVQRAKNRQPQQLSQWIQSSPRPGITIVIFPPRLTKSMSDNNAQRCLILPAVQCKIQQGRKAPMIQCYYSSVNQRWYQLQQRQANPSMQFKAQRKSYHFRFQIHDTMRGCNSTCRV